VAIAAATQLLIYWHGYTTMVLSDGTKVSNLISFRQYMNIVLTNAHYTVRFRDVGEVCFVGYLLAGVQFIAYLVGGLATYGALKDQPFCAACNLYMKTLGEKKKSFADSEIATSHYEKLGTVPMDGPDFKDLIETEAKVDNAVQGAQEVISNLLGCPKCNTQMIEVEVK
jgi:hypothetical protein